MSDLKIKEVISLVQTPRGPSPVEPSHPDIETFEVDDDDPWRRITPLEDVAPYSINQSVDQLIASHLHRAAGACRWLGRDIIVWTEVPYTEVKASGRTHSDEVPWQKMDGTRKGKYSLLVTAEHQYWGLSPAFQKLWMCSDGSLNQLGLKLSEQKNPFVADDEVGGAKTIRVLTMQYSQITTSPTRENLSCYCALRD